MWNGAAVILKPNPTMTSASPATKAGDAPSVRATAISAKTVVPVAP